MTTTSVREEKAAVIAEVRGKLEASDAAIVTEYRGMSVAALAQLRRELRNAGAEYKVYKNTLARFAVREAGLEGLEEFLVGLNRETGLNHGAPGGACVVAGACVGAEESAVSPGVAPSRPCCR